MLNESELLIQGEHTLGHFEVEIVRCGENGWVPTVPPLDALVTNYRLILQPQTRRRYEPASIPNSYITRFSELELGRRSGVGIALKTGHQLYLYVSWVQNNPFTEALKAMLTTPSGNAFKDHPAERDIQRLIQFIQQI